MLDVDMGETVGILGSVDDEDGVEVSGWMVGAVAVKVPHQHLLRVPLLN
jgi:hypothetical protein